MKKTIRCSGDMTCKLGNSKLIPDGAKKMKACLGGNKVKQVYCLLIGRDVTIREDIDYAH